MNRGGRESLLSLWNGPWLVGRGGSVPVGGMGRGHLTAALSPCDIFLKRVRALSTRGSSPRRSTPSDARSCASRPCSAQPPHLPPTLVTSGSPVQASVAILFTRSMASHHNPLLTSFSSELISASSSEAAVLEFGQHERIFEMRREIRRDIAAMGTGFGFESAPFAFRGVLCRFGACAMRTVTTSPGRAALRAEIGTG